MKIGNSTENLSQILASQGSATQAGAGAPSASGTREAAEDAAHLSSISGQITQATSSSEVRLDKVTAIQNALAAGTYSVPASQVAAKLVDAMLKGNH